MKAGFILSYTLAIIGKYILVIGNDQYPTVINKDPCRSFTKYVGKI